MPLSGRARNLLSGVGVLLMLIGYSGDVFSSVALPSLIASALVLLGVSVLAYTTATADDPNPAAVIALVALAAGTGVTVLVDLGVLSAAVGEPLAALTFVSAMVAGGTLLVAPSFSSA